VSITIVSAVIAPGNASGVVWDGSALVETGVVNGVLTLAANEGAEGKVLAIVGRYVFGEVTKPDPYGTVRVFVDGELATQSKLPQRHDTLVPTWRTTLTKIAWTDDTRASVSLSDSDLDRDQTIGVVEIPHAVLESALADGKVRFYAVADQSRGQLVYIALSVATEGWVYEAPRAETDNDPDAEPDTKKGDVPASRPTPRRDPIVQERCDAIVDRVLTLIEEDTSRSAQQKNELRRSARIEALPNECIAAAPDANDYDCAMSAGTIDAVVNCVTR
jgi:hypothetical protein